MEMFMDTVLVITCVWIGISLADSFSEGELFAKFCSGVSVLWLIIIGVYIFTMSWSAEWKYSEVEKCKEIMEDPKWYMMEAFISNEDEDAWS